MISHKHRCIFIHIPKCAGTSVENVIWPRHERTEADLWMGFVRPMHNKYQTGGLQHLLARQVREEVGPEIFHSYYKFSFVRNPWDRLVSQFSYMMTTRQDLREFLGIAETASFEEYLGKISTKKHVQWERQVDFLYDESGDLLVDFVGRVEHIGSDARQVFTRIGLGDVELPHVMRSKRGDYRTYYTPSSRDLVGELYKADVDAFAYCF